VTNDRPSDASSTNHSTRARRLGNWSAVLMSLAALATSWASYQASIWSGLQALHASNAAEVRAKSTRAYTRAGQLRMIDIGTFAHWMTAKSGHDSALAGFIASHFRDEFKSAFESWMASRPLRSATASPTPFAHASYRLTEEVVADSLDRVADREAAAAQRANRIGDSYVLDAVIMATVLFFARSEMGGVRPHRILMLLIATGMFATGLIRLLAAPRA
jgi:hypothetical protein